MPVETTFKLNYKQALELNPLDSTIKKKVRNKSFSIVIYFDHITYNLSKHPENPLMVVTERHSRKSKPSHNVVNFFV